MSSSNSRRSVDRRDFLKAAAAGAASTSLLHAAGPNEKLNIACIGVGGRGGANLAGVSSENIVAVCDVNDAAVEQAASKHKNAKKFSDYRKVFDHANEFDAVVVSTCEHTHASIVMAALRLGKHVYCEKPLTHNVWEASVVRETAAKANVATQMGIQIHAVDNYRRVVELVRSGAVGPIRSVDVWTSRAWGWQSPEDAKTHNDIVSVLDRPKESQPIPKGLHWDLWIGPAQERPFHGVYVPGPKWYRWWEFGNGTMSDLGSHFNDLPFWALDLKSPISVEAFGPPPHPEIAPASMRAVYEYGPRGLQPAVTVTWHQGVEKPRAWKESLLPKGWDNGILFTGDKGMILSDYSRHVLLPEKQFAGFQPPERTIASSPGHYAEWILAAKSGKQSSCNFEYSGWLTEANHLGNVAYRVGKKILWDAENVRCTNASEADQFLRREYRSGWVL